MSCWISKPIKKTCEVWIDNKRTECGEPTTKVYPAMGGGYMALCREHGMKHPYAWPIQEVDEILSK